MPSVAQKRYLERACETYADQLHTTSHGVSLSGAIGYLRDHAITQDIAIRYSLGFVGEPLPGDERFLGMLAIPYLTPNGVAQMRFRNLSGEGGKIAQVKGQSLRLYNTVAYFSAAEAIGIAEGEMDAIAATEHLGLATLGVPGVEAWKDHWTPILRDFTRVYIFADGDQRGRDFAEEMAERAGWRARVVRCPDGEDVSSMAAANRLSEISIGNREEEE